MGPVCSILLEQPLSDRQIAELDGYLMHIGTDVNRSDGKQSWDFYPMIEIIIPGSAPDNLCTFSLSTWAGLIDDWGAEEQPEEAILQQLEQAIGFRPHGHIMFYSGCNGQQYHLLLGYIAIALLEKFGGYINFCGDVMKRKQDLIYEGQLLDIWYETTPGNQYYYQIADLQFLKAFIKQDNFRMIK
ncbi:hypothetical protein CJD36_016615 [Flavipsychrobacter stenotrophus]|uniref:Uncharacterized protein n=1 Tax=Flavipsychrobacter stenotrophus TaxID=2077091 RepID=A0A2S7SU77_9BACT|nr:DUF6368 family protein [Flavipsychrobacter stenotrophus]PQJ10304.1 hypothetical protein CJD36_016615 [Flavipsychrobacter stenotrophus]